MQQIAELFFDKTGQKALGIEILGGMTNVNYLVKTAQKSYVLRVSGPRSHLIIDRQNEEFFNSLACEEGLNVPVVYFDAKTGLKISEFLQKALTLNEEICHKYSPLIAKKLKAMHAIKPQSDQAKHCFRPFSQIDLYLLQDKEGAAQKFSSFKKALSLFRDLEQEIGEINLKTQGQKELKALCHNDLVPQNILHDDGRVFIIDWEYAGLNDPYFDLASVFVESSFSKEQEQEFLGFYEANEAEISKIELYKSTQDILWAAWAFAKPQDADYDDYAAARLEAALKRHG